MWAVVWNFISKLSPTHVWALPEVENTTTESELTEGKAVSYRSAEQRYRERERDEKTTKSAVGEKDGGGEQWQMEAWKEDRRKIVKWPESKNSWSGKPAWQQGANLLHAIDQVKTKCKLSCQKAKASLRHVKLFSCYESVGCILLCKLYYYVSPACVDFLYVCISVKTNKDFFRGSVRPRTDGFTYPDLNVIRALVILFVEDLKVVLSGRD